MFELMPYRNRSNSVFDPFRDWDAWQKEFFGRNSFAGFKTDIKDEGDAYLLEADLPGCKKEDIAVELHDKYLTITAERHSEAEEEEKKGAYLRCERSYGSYSRSFDVSAIDQDAISVSYDNGVLKLTLPKKKDTAAGTRRLEIQ